MNMILGGTVTLFQYSSLYNPVDKRVRERVRKMLLMGVTQRSEMRRHLNVFVEENFPSVSKLDASYYPSDQSLSSIMYRAMILHRHSHLDQEKVLKLVCCLLCIVLRDQENELLFRCVSVTCQQFQVEGWREQRQEDFVFFRPATQESEIGDEDDVTVQDVDVDVDEDDILYSSSREVGESDACSLIFIHQSYDQLQILKR